jgi:prepilin-type N-terminal cleavage/methylation domain-containing protein
MRTAIRPKYGFTLIEVILALTITAAACTVTAMLLNAVANTWHTNDGISDAVNSARNGLLRVRSYIEQARFLGICDGTSLLLWSKDLDGDNQPDYCEMILIRYKSAAQKIELVDIYFPPSTPQSDIDARKTDLTMANFTSTNSVITTMSTDPYARVRTLAENVGQFSLTLDKASPFARYATLSMKITRQGISQYFQTVITPRSSAYYLLE